MASITSSVPVKAEVSSEEAPQSPSRSLAILLCLIPAFYFVAIVAYAVVNFSAYGADVPRFLRYIAAPSLIAVVLLAAALLLPPRKGANVGLGASAILIALLLVELALNARLVIAMLGLVSNLGTGTGENGEALRGRSNIPPMYTSKQMSSAMDVEHLNQAVLGGLPSRETLLCSRLGQPEYYTSDRYGFNNDDGVHDAPLEVMIVGDSFVEGHCQPRPDTFAGKMRELRPQTASVGMRGGGPLFGLALIGRYGREFRPDWVAMAFYEGNDWGNLKSEAGTSWLAEALSPDAAFGSPELSATQLEGAEEVVTAWWSEEISPGVVFTRSSFIRNILGLNQVWGFLGLDYPRIRREQPIYGEVLAEAKAVSQSWGGKMVLIYIPQAARYRGLLDKSFAYDGLRGEVLAAAQVHDVEVVDLTDVFHAHENPRQLFAADGHFSPAGSEVAARALEAKIASLPSS
jgi:hypothetical protein